MYDILIFILISVSALYIYAKMVQNEPKNPIPFLYSVAPDPVLLPPRYIVTASVTVTVTAEKWFCGMYLLHASHTPHN